MSEAILVVDLHTVKNSLSEALASSPAPDAAERYWRYLNRFLLAKISKVEFDAVVSEVLPGDAVMHHNHFIIGILHNARVTAYHTALVAVQRERFFFGYRNTAFDSLRPRASLRSRLGPARVYATRLGMPAPALGAPPPANPSSPPPPVPVRRTRPLTSLATLDQACNVRLRAQPRPPTLGPVAGAVGALISPQNFRPKRSVVFAEHALPAESASDPSASDRYVSRPAAAERLVQGNLQLTKENIMSRVRFAAQEEWLGMHMRPEVRNEARGDARATRRSFNVTDARDTMCAAVHALVQRVVSAAIGLRCGVTASRDVGSFAPYGSAAFIDPALSQSLSYGAGAPSSLVKFNTQWTRGSSKRDVGVPRLPPYCTPAILPTGEPVIAVRPHHARDPQAAAAATATPHVAVAVARAGQEAAAEGDAVSDPTGVLRNGGHHPPTGAPLPPALDPDFTAAASEVAAPAAGGVSLLPPSVDPAVRTAAANGELVECSSFVADRVAEAASLWRSGHTSTLPSRASRPVALLHPSALMKAASDALEDTHAPFVGFSGFMYHGCGAGPAGNQVPALASGPYCDMVGADDVRAPCGLGTVDNPPVGGPDGRPVPSRDGGNSALSPGTPGGALIGDGDGGLSSRVGFAVTAADLVAAAVDSSAPASPPSKQRRVAPSALRGAYGGAHYGDSAWDVFACRDAQPDMTVDEMHGNDGGACAVSSGLLQVSSVKDSTVNVDGEGVGHGSEPCGAAEHAPLPTWSNPYVLSAADIAAALASSVHRGFGQSEGASALTKLRASAMQRHNVTLPANECSA